MDSSVASIMNCADQVIKGIPLDRKQARALMHTEAHDTLFCWRLPTASGSILRGQHQFLRGYQCPERAVYGGLPLLRPVGVLSYRGEGIRSPQ